MQKAIKNSAIGLSLMVLLTACPDPYGGEYYNGAYDAYTMGRHTMENAIAYLPPRAMVNTGQIYSYQNWLFINEMFEGIHVFDNTDPNNPVAHGFLRIPGNLDIAIQNNQIVVDQAVDLVVLDWDGTTATEVSRTRDVFEPLNSPDGWIPQPILDRPDSLIIIKWELK